MTQPTTSDPDERAAKARAKLDAATAKAFAGIDADTDAATTAALGEAKAATAKAHADADAASDEARKATAADAAAYRRSFDGTRAPLLGGGFAGVARDHLQAATKDATFKKVEALIGRLPSDRTRRMVERLAVRAYAQGSNTTRAFLRHLVQVTKSTPPRQLEGQVDVALRVHADECAAEIRDLWDVHTASVQAGPGRELATVRTTQMQRVAGLTDDDDTEMIVLDGPAGRRTQGGTR